VNDKTKYYTYITPRMYIPENVYAPYIKNKWHRYKNNSQSKWKGSCLI
jgi:hypothetical protein